MSKQLVLLGGGHAHVHVLRALATLKHGAAQVTLISPATRQIYSGMLPGWMAGAYSMEQCTIPLDSMCARAGVRFVQATAIGLDLSAKWVLCDGGHQVAFDVLSINSGPQIHLDRLAGAVENALAIRPLEAFVAGWSRLLERARDVGGRFSLAIAGAGAAGVELAFAARAGFDREGLENASITLLGDQAAPLSGFSGAVRRHVARRLGARRIAFYGNRRVTAIHRDQLELNDGSSLPADGCVMATGAEAANWPAASGLACNLGGFIRVNTMLQSISHPFIFGAGDAVELPVPRPKSGVFAVRSGPPLAENLVAFCAERPLMAWHPQRRALYLLSTGDQHALASWGPFSVSGRWVWKWKNHIDQSFIDSFKV